MAGILSIGWYIPEGRRDRDAIASDYLVGSDPLAAFGLHSHAVAGDEDHPSTMGARATRAALAAANLKVEDIDLLIFTGMTRDYPTPWVGAFGVLHELNATHAGGFDINNRCTGLHDALWVAASLVQAGAHNNVVVCAADRFDYLLGPPRKVGQISDTAYSAGSGAAVVSRRASNEIAAFSHLTNENLALHEQFCPKIGGSRRPVDQAGLEDGLHRWQNTMKLCHSSQLAQYMQAADRHNLTTVCQRANFDEIDFLACSPLDVKAQLASLASLGIGSEKTLFTLPHLGHIGSADSIIGLGIGAAIGRNLGDRVVMSTRSAVYSNALAIRALGVGMGVGIRTCAPESELSRWREVEESRLAAFHSTCPSVVTEPERTAA
jgi:3-oxoacyl-[acyl-carrier-protein] synthase-3